MTLGRLFGVNALIRVAAAMSGQLFAFLLAEKLGARGSEGAIWVGLLAACFFASELAFAPFAGRLGDAHGQARVLRRAPLFGVITGLAAALAGGVEAPLSILVGVLAIARIVEGLGAAFAVPTTLALLAGHTSSGVARRTRVMGLFEVSSLVAMVLGYALAGVGWDHLGWRAFLLLTPIYVAARLLLGGLAAPNAAPSAPSPVSTWQALARFAEDRNHLAFAGAWLSVNAVVGLWMQQTPYLLRLPERSPTQSLVGGFSGTEIGAVFAVWGVTFLVGIGGWALFAARMPRRRALTVSLFGMLGVVVSLFAANRGAGPWALGLAAACVLVESGFTPSALAYLADATEKAAGVRGTTMGIYSLLLGGGQLAGGLLGGPVAARWQMNGLLGATGALAAVALVCVRAMRVR